MIENVKFSCDSLERVAAKIVCVNDSVRNSQLLQE